jgi:hypothetical protein
MKDKLKQTWNEGFVSFPWRKLKRKQSKITENRTYTG